MKKIYVLFILLSICTAVSAQTEAIMQEAKERMVRSDYMAVIKLLEKDAAKKDARAEVLEMMGDCYRLMGDKDKAQTYYQKAIDTGECSPGPYRYSGLFLLSNGKYEEAKAKFKVYANTLDVDSDSYLLIATCDTAMAWIARKDSSVFQISLLQKVNSRYSEWGAELFNGNLIFTSNRPQNKRNNTDRYYTMYQARATKGNPGSFNSANVLYSNLTGRKHVGPMIFTNDKKTMYYSQTNTDVLHKKQTEDGKVWENKIEIMTAKMGGRGPTNIKSFKYNAPRQYSVGHPCLSPNGNILYFVSDMPGGYGGIDLYFSRLENGEWSEPENCGPKINTESDEMFPTIDSTGVFYFSSNGRIGLGGFDIYRAKGEGSKWTHVENLRYPVNSCGDDFHLVFNPDYQSGYLSSNRPGGMGDDDIYQFTLSGLLPDFGYIDSPKKYENKMIQENGLRIKGIITAQASGNAIEGASISFIDSAYKTQTICMSDPNGEFNTLLYKNRTYTYSSIRDGYVPTINQTITSDAIIAQNNTINIVMQEVKAEEENVIAKNVFLDTGEGTGIEYSVQVMASKEYPDWTYLDKISESYPHLKIYYGSFPDAFTRFTVGRFKTVREATRLKNDLRKMGYSDAFVVMFIDGVRKVVSYN